MPVVKANPNSPQPTSPVTFSLRDVEEQAVALLSRARHHADDLMRQAEVDAEALRQSAHAEGEARGQAEGRAVGLQQGQAEGRKQALADHSAKLSELVKTLSEAASQLNAQRAALEQAATNDVVRLAIAIAHKAVAAFATKNPDAVVANVSEALRFVVGRNDVQIIVHSTQKKLLDESTPALQAKWPALQHVTVIADDSVSPAGARIITRQGEVDATLDGLISRIAAELVGAES
jgi:flagellar biosynthesis/type III secretory pathway protein FliH